MASALRRHDMTVQNKSGGFITVVFRSPDGGKASIDIYTCFHVGDLLYETATVAHRCRVGDRAADRAGVRGPDAARAARPRPDARGQPTGAAGGCPTRRSSTARDPR